MELCEIFFYCSCAQRSYTERFDFEVDKLDSIKVSFVEDVIHCPDVGGNLRKMQRLQHITTHIATSSDFDLLLTMTT